MISLTIIYNGYFSIRIQSQDTRHFSLSVVTKVERQRFRSQVKKHDEHSKNKCVCDVGKSIASSASLIIRFYSLQTVQHGFPNKPTALAWDPSLRLMIIGTASGAIKVYPFAFLAPRLRLPRFLFVRYL